MLQQRQAYPTLPLAYANPPPQIQPYSFKLALDRNNETYAVLHSQLDTLRNLMSVYQQKRDLILADFRNLAKVFFILASRLDSGGILTGVVL